MRIHDISVPKICFLAGLALIYVCIVTSIARSETQASDSGPPAGSITGTNADAKRGIFATFPNARPNVTTIENSDRILHRELGLAFTRGGGPDTLTFYEFNALDIRGTADWLHYHGSKYLLSSDYKLSPEFRLSTTIGVGQLSLDDFLKVSYDELTTLPLYRLRLIYEPLPKTEIRFEPSDDFSYVGWLDDQKNPQVMPITNFFLEVETFSIPGWQLRTNLREAFLTDGNQQQVFDNLIMRDLISPEQYGFQLKVGVGGGTTTFRQQLAYWSPSHLETVNARLIFSRDFERRWNFETKLMYGYHHELGREPGKEADAEVHLQYNGETGWNVKIAGNFFDSEDHNWWRRDLSVSAEIPL